MATIRRRNGINEEIVANGVMMDDAMVFDSLVTFQRYLWEYSIGRRSNIGRSNMGTGRRINVVVNGEMIEGAQMIDGYPVFDSIFMLRRHQAIMLQRNQSTMSRRNMRNDARNDARNEAVVATDEIIDDDAQMIDGAKDAKEESEECCICLRGMRASESMRQPHPCSHVFHYHCIARWLQIKNTCPLCRRTIHL